MTSVAAIRRDTSELDPMFDGSFKSSRTVNLSGRRRRIEPQGRNSLSSISAPVKADTNVNTPSTATSKQALLEHAKQSRTQRQTMKKQEHAALLLQTSWRRVYTAKTLRAKLLRQLEAEFSAYSIPIQSQVPVSDRLQPHHFLRYLIVIHNISQQVSFPVQDENSQWDLEESFIQLFWADISTKSDAIPTNQPFSIHIDRYLFGAAAVTSPHAPERNVWLYQTLFLIRVLFKHTLTPLQLPSKHAEAFLRHLLSSKSYSHYGDIVISKLLHRLSEPPNSIFAIVLAHLSTLHDTVFGEWIGELFVSALNLKCNEKAINEFVWHTIRTAGAMRHPLVVRHVTNLSLISHSLSDAFYRQNPSI